MTYALRFLRDVGEDATAGVRIIPVPGKGAGQEAEFGGLLGRGPVLAVHGEGSARFVRRAGRIPAPVKGLRN